MTRVLEQLYGWPPSHDVSDTAWLDGMRGTAASMVAIHHLGRFVYPERLYEAPYGAMLLSKDGVAMDNSALTQLWRLPVLRLLFLSGHAQVNVFFVLSGCVLSLRPLQSLASSHAACANTLSSSLIRRWLRLYLPVFGISIFTTVLARIGLLPIYDNLVQPDILSQIADLLKATERFANPFSINRIALQWTHSYDWTYWTIPMEYFGSLVIFTFCFATSQYSSRKRLILAMGFGAYALLKADWAIFSFLSGHILAILVTEQGSFGALSSTLNAGAFFWAAVLISALLLMGAPTWSSVYARGFWGDLDSFIPSVWTEWDHGVRLWWTLGGTLFVISSAHLRSIRALLSRRLPRYLGRLSFMLYLAHYKLLAALTGMLKPPILRILCKIFVVDPDSIAASLRTSARDMLLMCSLFLFTAPLVILVAFWLTVLVDEPSVRAARALAHALNDDGD